MPVLILVFVPLQASDSKTWLINVKLWIISSSSSFLEDQREKPETFRLRLLEVRIKERRPFPYRLPAA